MAEQEGEGEKLFLLKSKENNCFKRKGNLKWGTVSYWNCLGCKLGIATLVLQPVSERRALTCGNYCKGPGTNTICFQINQPIRCTSLSAFVRSANRTDHDQQHCYHHVPTVNKRRLLQLINSWWWAWGYSKHVELYLTLRRLMSYIYGAPILDVSRSYTTTQHSR